MSHANISVFIPHMGCPNACSFCNQRTISSTAHAPSPDEAEDIIRGAYEYMSPEKRRNTEIAFFGGSLQPMAGFTRVNPSCTAFSSAERQVA